MIDLSLVNPDHPRMAPAIAELSERVRARFPDAEIVAEVGYEPVGVYLVVTVDADLDDIIDSVIERLVTLQVEEGLPLYLFPLTPLMPPSGARVVGRALLPTGN